MINFEILDKRAVLLEKIDQAGKRRDAAVRAANYIEAARLRDDVIEPLRTRLEECQAQALRGEDLDLVIVLIKTLIENLTVRDLFMIMNDERFKELDGLFKLLLGDIKVPKE